MKTTEKKLLNYDKKLKNLDAWYITNSTIMKTLEYPMNAATISETE
jgi:hypothetical protein